jgi:hypothetical protein
MSGLLNEVLRAGGGQAIEMLGGRFGLGPAQAKGALEALLPMVAGGMKQQASQAGGIEGLLGTVLGQQHVAYGEDANVLARPGNTEAGNQILGAIFNNDRDVSRTVAAQAAQQTGLPVDMLKKMLPVVAMMAAGALAKNANAGGLGGLLGAAMGAAGGQSGALAGAMAGAQSGGGMLGNILGAAMGGGMGASGQQGGAGALGGLASMLDMDRDGNPLDDIMGMLGRR